MLAEADRDHDGFISENEWNGVQLWFQYRAFQPGVSEHDMEGAYAEVQPEARRARFDRCVP